MIETPYEKYTPQANAVVAVPKSHCKKEGSFASNEPISVLDTISSPSPSTSTSAGGGGGGGGWKDEWVAQLHPIVPGLEVGCFGESERFGLELENWDSILFEQGQDSTFVRWLSGDFDGTNEISGNAALGVVDQSSVFVENLAIGNNNVDPQNPIFCLSSANQAMNSQQQQTTDEELQTSTPQVMISPPQFQGIAAVNLLLCCTQRDQHHQFQPQNKRQNMGSPQIPKDSIFDPGHEFLLKKQLALSQIQPPQVGFAQQLNLNPQHLQQKPFMVPKQEAVERCGGSGNGGKMVPLPYHQQQRVVHEQLYKTAQLISAGSFSHAQEILARLNHHISPTVQPCQRAAFYFKEALQLALLLPNLPRFPTPFDGVFKMGAYKLLSEISPLTHFINFTSNQVLFEALDDAQNIHIIDFDIGFGAQWSSFMQELPKRNNGMVVPSMKITAFASPLTHHQIELGLMYENLTQLSKDIGVNFELEVVNFDTFEPNCCSMPPFRSSQNEAILVNFPIWATHSHLSLLPSILRFIKKLSPRIVVSCDNGCGRTELPFPQHLLHALHYHEVLLDSIDAVNVTSDIINKIERFLFLPRIESIVFGRLQAPVQMPSWKSLFAFEGFSPVVISNFAESQAECVVKSSPVGGFHAERRQGSLTLCWQHQELVSASAWR